MMMASSQTKPTRRLLLLLLSPLALVPHQPLVDAAAANATTTVVDDDDDDVSPPPCSQPFACLSPDFNITLNITSSSPTSSADANGTSSAATGVVDETQCLAACQTCAGSDWGCADFAKATHTDRTADGGDAVTVTYRCQCARMDNVTRACVEEGEWREVCVDPAFPEDYSGASSPSFGILAGTRFWLGAGSLFLGGVAWS